jgi:hypothetical protein
MKNVLYRIHVSYASRIDEFPFARTRSDVMFSILIWSEQRVIVKFLFNDGLDARQITEKLRLQFYKDAYSFDAVRFWIGEMRRVREGLHDRRWRGRWSHEHIAATIQQLLTENPFESARPTAETLDISHCPVLKYFHEDFHFKSFYLRWLPHLLTQQLRELRYQRVSEMISVLTFTARDDWHHFATRDESRLFVIYSARRIWILTRDDVATKPTHDMHMEESMLKAI